LMWSWLTLLIQSPVSVQIIWEDGPRSLTRLNLIHFNLDLLPRRVASLMAGFVSLQAPCVWVCSLDASHCSVSMFPYSKMAAAWLKPGIRLSVANKPVLATREVTLRTCFYLVRASAKVLSSSELTGP
jgi:hypothetical protein